MNKMFTLWRAAVSVCVLLFGLSFSGYSQCDPGETEYEITLASGGSFVGERSWEIVPTLGGDPVISQDCGDYAGGTFSFCLTPGVSYDFIAYDDFGDGWNFFGVDPVWSIAIVGGPVVIEGGNPNGCSSGDFTTNCIGQCEEYSETFIASDPPDCVAADFSLVTERSCDDFNFSATVTIDEISPGASLLLITADAGGVQLAGATVPNLVGQTATLEDLPLDEDVIFSVNVLGATCPNTEIVSVSSIGCPVPLTCGEGLAVNYCYTDLDESIFLYESPNDEPVILYFEDGLIESCCDDVFIYDGADNTGELLFGGNNGGDLAGVAVTANSGSLFIELDTDFSVNCENGSFGTSEWNWIVGCGEFDIPGCTDPEAVNYIPEATVDDGSCILPAVNDEPCGAIALECNGPSLTGNFDAASISEDIFPLSECGSTFNPANGDLWFQFDADGTSTYLISAENGPDMVVALYSGDDCGTLTLEEECSDFPESFSGVYEEGTYYFVVRPWSGSTFNNSYEVSLTCVDGAPDNDEPCGATELVCGAEPQNGAFLGATSTLDDACFGSGTADVWLTFVSDGETAYGIQETSFSDVVISMYTAGECDGELEEVVACQDFPESFNGIYDAGVYYIRVRPWSTAQTYAVSLTCTEPAENDLACGAIEVDCETGIVSGTTIGATLDDDCGGAAGGAGIWYVFNSDIDGTLQLNTCQDITDFDSDISIFTGTCDDLTCYEYNDGDFTCGFASDVTVDIFNGTTYYILVHGWTTEGNFDMEITCTEIELDCPGLGDFGDPCDDGDLGTINDVVTEECECVGTPPPPGTICGAPIIVEGIPYFDTGNNTSGFGDDYEFSDIPPLAPDGILVGTFFSTSYLSGDDVIYEYTPTEDQQIDVRIDNIGTWAGLYVFTGCPFESTVGAHTEFPATFREIEALPVTAGVTYYIAIGTFAAPQTTPYDLSIVLNVDDCPELDGDFGDPCNDGDPLTTDDVITEDCECVGTEVIPGQICDLPIEVTSLPYLTSDNTINYFDDYDGADLPPLAPDAISNGYSNFYLGGDDVFYAYTPTEDGMIDVNLNNHGTWTGLFVITGCPLASTVGSHTGSDNLGREIEMLPVTAGTTYYIVVSTWPAPQNTAYDLSINFAGIDCPELDADFGDPCDDGDPLTNDDVVNQDCECAGTPVIPGQICDLPIEVDALPYLTTDNTINYFDDYEGADLPALAPDAISNGYSTLYFGGDDVVYSYTPEEDGMIDVTLSNHGSWTGLFVITGCPFESTVGSHTGSDALGREIEMLPVTAGTTYYIVVSTWPFPQNTAYDLSINVAGFDCPDLEADFGDPCDDGDPLTTDDVIDVNCECAGTPIIPGQICELPIEVEALPYLTTDNTINFFDDYEGADLPALAPDAVSNGYSTLYFGGDEVVYSYTPEEDGIIDVTLSNHGSWTGLFVITGCPFESTVGSHTASDANGREIETLPVTAGTTYYIVVSTWPAPQNTAYDLSINVGGFDCPDLEADFGDSCDDGDDNTINDVVTADCECAGTPTPTTQCGDYTSAPDLDFGLDFGTEAIITDDIVVSGANGTLTDLNVVVVIDHIWTSDVDVRLTSPAGTTIDLILDPCGSGDDINVLLDDDGPALACATGSTPVLFGTFSPEGNLSDFNGEDFDGTWTIEVEDDVPTIDDGTLVSWCLIPTLETGENTECENATNIAATPEFAGSLTAASMADAVASGDAQCINADNPQSDMWFSFESVTTNMYVRAWGLNDFDAAVEVYDSCGGELLNCQNDEPAGEREVVIITNTTVGETYYFRVYHAGDAAPVEQDFTVAVAHIPFTQLSDDDCGVFDYTPADMITTDLPVNQFLLTSWYFEFTELEAPFNTYEILSPNGANPNFMLQWFTQAEYGRTYEVRTRARMYQGPQWGDYGDACTIGFSSVPLTTQIIEEQALGFYDMCDVLEADNVPGAETYRFKFYNGFGDPLIHDSPSRFCQLDLVPGLELGSPYAVIVRVLTQGVVSANGEIRLIAMNNFVPDTQLDNAITDCGATYPLNTVVSAVNICAAEYYTFRFTNISDANQEDLFYTRDDGLRSINLNWVIGLNPGDTYSVQVLGASGGLVGEYGPACEITIAGGADLTEFNGGGEELSSDVEIELYPNPTIGDEVMLNLSNLSEEQQEVMVEVYDLYGKKVHTQILGNNGSQMNAVISLPELASGIYNVNVVVNEVRIGAKKLVVR